MTEQTAPLAATFGPELAAALAAFQADMPKVHKGKTARVPTKNGGAYTYDYADLADVTDRAMPKLVQHGLSFVSCPQPGPKGYELVGYLIHKSGQHLTGALPLTGGTEQALGSSLTYLRRYLLGCMTGIVTDDDEDGAAATNAPRQQQTEPPQETPVQAARRGIAQAPDVAALSSVMAWAREQGVADAVHRDAQQRQAELTQGGEAA